MDEIYIEPDAGQSATIEVDDPGDFYWMSYNWKEPVFIGDSRMVILKYTQLETLGFVSGHRARLVVKGV
jgi:hypothetical protein